MIDFMVMEAVALKIGKEKEQSQKDAQLKADMKAERERLVAITGG